MATTTEKTRVSKSSTIGTDVLTVDCLEELAALCGAPKNATLTTGGAVPRVSNEGDSVSPTYYNYSVTFAWTEEV